MAKQSITKKASDNQYLHKDFHIALNFGIEYLSENFGAEGVREYLSQFAGAYYALLTKTLEKKGLCAIKLHYEEIYKIEGAGYDIDFSGEELTIHLISSPAVMHIKSQGHVVSDLYYETVAMVNKAICAGTLWDVELLTYDDETGGYRLHFFKRQK